jgi:putative ABC transport system permease protein
MLANITSLFALFIGMFIIYNSFAIAVTQRRSEIGILRALGATRGQIQVLFLAESAVGGLVGAGLGAGLGVLIARGMAGSLGNLLGEIYGVAQKAEEVSSDPRLLAGGGGVGADYESGGGVDSGAERGAGGPGAGAAEGEVSTADGGGEPGRGGCLRLYSWRWWR